MIARYSSRNGETLGTGGDTPRIAALGNTRPSLRAISAVGFARKRSPLTYETTIVTIGTPMSKGRAKTISDVLRQAIAESGMTYSELERATGVKRASILRFIRCERSLRLDNADALADYFGLRLTKGNCSSTRDAIRP